MSEIKDKYRRFKEWQVKPYEVMPLTDDEHKCCTCGTDFHGNYCPRCGQKATIGRYSFKTAFLTFLDVWGLGNRGMFRTIRDLMLRPGYMIRDYLSGMQMAYFPPFKLFFLLATLSVLVDSGFNVKRQNNISKAKETVAVKLYDESEEADAMDKTKKINEKELKKKEIGIKFANAAKAITDWILENQTIFQLIWLLVLSAPLYLFFRHSPNIPDIRYSEFFVGMIYITNMMTIIKVISGFLLPENETIPLLTYLLSVVPLSQLSGYSLKRSFFKVVGAFVLLIFLGIFLSTAIGFLAVFFSDGIN